VKYALLIIDMQRGFLRDRTCSPGLDSVLEYINAAIELFNAANQPVFFIQDGDAKEEPGHDSYELVDGLNEDIRHPVFLSKKYSNAFWQTSLEQRLRAHEAQFLVLAGFAAEGCVNYTYNGALERDFHAVLLKNGITSYKSRYTGFVQEICNTLSYSTLRFLLAQERHE
jgi:nicotinamidase-related amidase